MQIKTCRRNDLRHGRSRCLGDKDEGAVAWIIHPAGRRKLERSPAHLLDLVEVRLQPSETTKVQEGDNMREHGGWGSSCAEPKWAKCWFN